MTSLERIRRVAGVLVTSQLRSGRSGEKGNKPSFTGKPSFIALIDVIAFAASAALTYLVATLIPAELSFLVKGLTAQALSFLPVFTPALILLAGVMFELSASSKFASSDTMNWLPLTQVEYVAASAVSISFIYSVWISIGIGLTLGLSLYGSFLGIWAASLALTLISLFIGGVLVEMLRAAINRVSSAFYTKSGRGTLVLRIVITVIVVLAFQLVFNPTILMLVMTAFSNVISVTSFVPIVWPALAIRALLANDFSSFALFSITTLGFAAVAFYLAVKIRSRYWAPLSVSVSLTSKGYTPRAGILKSLGFSPAESSLISKDLKGLTRRRELLPMLTIPAVMILVILIQQFAVSTEGPSTPFQYSFFAWFIAGFFSVFIAATSVGQEGSAVLNVYSIPITPGEFLRAKAVYSLIITLVTALLISILSSFMVAFNIWAFAITSLISILIVIECTFLGLGFAMRFSDFQEKPRPRFLSQLAMLEVMLVGMGVMFLTGAPVMFLVTVQEAALANYAWLLFPVVVAITISFLAYRWARSGSQKLLAELRL